MSEQPTVRELTPLEYLQVTARKEQLKKKPLKPEMLTPDSWCYGYTKPKAAFHTEGKAYKALEIAQERRRIDNTERSETRFYKCHHGRKWGSVDPHFHLTSEAEYDGRHEDQESSHVHQD